MPMTDGGLTESAYNKFFDPFYTTNRSEGGSGLGTHIAYNLTTQLLKGRISIDRTINTGLKIDLQLPLYL